MVEQALSAKTLLTNISKYSAFTKTMKGSIAGDLLKSERAKHKPDGAPSERDLMQSDRTERAKGNVVDLLSSPKVNSFEEPDFF